MVRGERRCGRRGAKRQVVVRGERRCGRRGAKRQAVVRGEHRFHAIGRDVMAKYVVSKVVHDGLEVIFIHDLVKLGVGLVVDDNTQVHVLGTQGSILHPIVPSGRHNQVSSEPHQRMERNDAERDRLTQQRAQADRVQKQRKDEKRERLRK